MKKLTKMKNKLYKTLLTAALGLSACGPNQPAESPVQDDQDCWDVDLTTKGGFKGRLTGRDVDFCYSIFSAGNKFTEYVGLCEPQEGNIECYRTINGPNKGAMGLQFGMIGYAPIATRSPSGEITNTYPDNFMVEDLGKRFQSCEVGLNQLLTIPEFCQQLKQYNGGNQK